MDSVLHRRNVFTMDEVSTVGSIGSAGDENIEKKIILLGNAFSFSRILTRFLKRTAETQGTCHTSTGSCDGIVCHWCLYNAFMKPL